MDWQHWIAAALDEHLAMTTQLAEASSHILQVAVEVVETLRRHGKVVLFGNGGSASEAQHLAAEMQGIRAHQGTTQGLLALVLTDNTALVTAISNDVGYHDAFRRQVDAIVRGEDLVIGLSTSGHSQNVIEGLLAAQAARGTHGGLPGGERATGGRRRYHHQRPIPQCATNPRSPSAHRARHL